VVNFKTGRAGQPRLGRFDSFAASWHSGVQTSMRYVHPRDRDGEARQLAEVFKGRERRGVGAGAVPELREAIKLAEPVGRFPRIK
jgi:hypothetical protein